MSQPVSYFATTIFLFVCAALAACGSESGDPTVNSDLLGIYAIDSYRGNDLGCDNPTELDPPPNFVVLFSFLPNDDAEEPRLGGVLCGSVERCRAIARAAEEPPIGYSFIEGNDAAGWRGWAVPSGGPANDQCRAEVQAHVLTPDGDTIEIETKTFETVFEPALDGTTATCRVRDALLSLDNDPPCVDILVLDATFETDL